MKTIFELTQPRDEVLQGELSEEMFAARLKDVMDGTADPIYSHPDQFFNNTYLPHRRPAHPAARGVGPPDRPDANQQPDHPPGDLIRRW